MDHKIENVKTEIWRQIIDDLRSSGFKEIYQYDGVDAGIDYNRYDLINEDKNELIVFEWDNWTEGEIIAAPYMLKRLSEKYLLSVSVETSK